MKIGEANVAGKIYTIRISPEPITVGENRYWYDIHHESLTIWIDRDAPRLQACLDAQSEAWNRHARLLKVHHVQ